MRCDDIKILLDLYLDNELPEELRARVDRHLLRCPHCAYEVRTLEQTAKMLHDALPETDVRPAYRERTVARLMDSLASHLRHADAPEPSTQWSLKFPADEPPSRPS